MRAKVMQGRFVLWTASEKRLLGAALELQLVVLER